jgi:flagellar protein FlaG
MKIPEVKAPAPTTRGQLARQLVATPPPPPEAPEAPRGDSGGLKDAIEKANRELAGRNVDLRFGIHEASGAFYVRVLDPSTQEVLKTVPPEQLLDFRARLADARGILFDEVA